MDAGVIVVGAGLAGLLATHELTNRGQAYCVRWDQSCSTQPDAG
jgi:monoamine oxidase